MKEPEDVEAANIKQGDINEDGSEKKSKSKTKRFLIISAAIILAFSLIALSFAIFATIQVTKKKENNEDWNDMANQIEMKMNQSLAIESRMLAVFKIIQDNWNLKVSEFNTGMKIIHSTNFKMKNVEESLDIMNSRVSKMTSRVIKLENPPRDRRHGGSGEDTAQALVGGLLQIEEFKI